ncbi:hypothetical protein QQS21_003841 [Conoideocrella luteorostrata]|uniref:Alpha-1,3-mannosyltransferase n=1 Tax=Conoideocrella luteorostrata TaxID=1105319 RepID=A0AAJ0CTJ2_9HYPO|nr:hypothetical protein QQS21_003841 [Conoideocrella luteorostrata]
MFVILTLIIFMFIKRTVHLNLRLLLQPLSPAGNSGAGFENDIEFVEQKTTHTTLLASIEKKAQSPWTFPRDSGQSRLSIPYTNFPERPKLEDAFARIAALLPGELETRELLKYIKGTGAEKLHEIGLRTREYGKLLSAWEDLHSAVVRGKDDSFVRDDIIQYLQHHQLASSTTPENHHELAVRVQNFEAYKSLLSKLEHLLFPWTAPYFAGNMALHYHFKHGGRGIVLTANSRQAQYLQTSIPTIRKLGCTLPIEIMYLGDSDLGDDYRTDLEALDGVITRDVESMVNDEGWELAGWAVKPFAILFSSFREVIFIDADSLFFQNPAILFDDHNYQKTGALFFKDRSMHPASKKKWLQRVLPKPISAQARKTPFWTGESSHVQESGVIVVDKWRHFIALLMVARMNGPERDGNKAKGIIGVYDMVYGDKETFWLGWELVGDSDYAFHQGEVGAMGVLRTPPIKDKEGMKPSGLGFKSGSDLANARAVDGTPVFNDTERQECSDGFAASGELLQQVPTMITTLDSDVKAFVGDVAAPTAQTSAPPDWISSALKTATSFLGDALDPQVRYKVVGKVIKFAFTIAGKVFSFVVDTLNSFFPAFTSFLRHAIKAGMQKLMKLLGYRFDVTRIKQTQEVLIAAFNASKSKTNMFMKMNKGAIRAGFDLARGTLHDYIRDNRPAPKAEPGGKSILGWLFDNPIIKFLMRFNPFSIMVEAASEAAREEFGESFRFPDFSAIVNIFTKALPAGLEDQMLNIMRLLDSVQVRFASFKNDAKTALNELRGLLGDIFWTLFDAIQCFILTL